MAGSQRRLQRDGFDASPVVSARMKRVRRAHTRPEVRLRSALWRNGLRFYNDYRIAGRHVDVAFPRRRLAVYLDGCFWHGCPEHWSLPGKNRAYWRRKIQVVRDRDARDTLQLVRAGWIVLRFWEHEVVKSPVDAVKRVEDLVRHGA